MDSYIPIMKRLNDHEVEYVLVGGYAAAAHGSSILTKDIDFCASLDEPNLSRILAAIRDLNPRFRMRPDKMRVPDDPARLRGFKMLNLHTDLGVVDFLADLPGVGTVEDAMRQSKIVSFGAVSCRLLNLNALIAAKETAGRQKDIRAIAELKAIKARIDAEGESLFPEST